MDTQLEWFANNVQELNQMLGPEKTQDFLHRSLFAVILGSNDYINNYLLSSSTAGRTYSIPEFQDLLVETFLGQLQVSGKASNLQSRSLDHGFSILECVLNVNLVNKTLQRMYELGARNVSIASIGPIIWVHSIAISQS